MGLQLSNDKLSLYGLGISIIMPCFIVGDEVELSKRALKAL